jgi:hypothetical protein
MDRAFYGPVLMAQPREYPTLVAVGAQVKKELISKLFNLIN